MSAASEAWEVGQAETTPSFVSQFAQTLAVFSDSIIRAYYRHAGRRERRSWPLSRPPKPES